MSSLDHDLIKQSLAHVRAGRIDLCYESLRAAQEKLSQFPEDLQSIRAGMIERIFSHYSLPAELIRPAGQPSTSVISGFREDIKEGISVVTCCRNRNQNLRTALSSWLRCREIDEIVVVDWSSCDPIYAFLKHYNLLDPRVNVIRDNFQGGWALSLAYNLGFRLASFDKILKLDSDIVLGEKFFETNVPKAGHFVAGNQKVVNRREQIYINGTFFADRSNLVQVNGFNEYLTSYGWEDDDLYERLSAIGLTRVDVDPETLYHLPHPDNERIGSRRSEILCANDSFESDVDYQIVRNRNIARVLPVWGPSQQMRTYLMTFRGLRYCEVEQCGDQRISFCDQIISDAEHYAKLDILYRRRKIAGFSLDKAKAHQLFRERQLSEIDSFDIDLLSLPEIVNLDWRKKILIVQFEFEMDMRGFDMVLEWVTHLSIANDLTVFIDSDLLFQKIPAPIYGADIRRLPKLERSINVKQMELGDYLRLNKGSGERPISRIRLRRTDLSSIKPQVASYADSDPSSPNTLPALSADSSLSVWPSYTIAGRKISVPKDILPTEQILTGLQRASTKALAYLATRVFADRSLFIEQLSEDHMASVMLALLFSDKPVVTICNSAVEKQFVQAVAIVNAIGNIYPYLNDRVDEARDINRYSFNKFLTDRGIVASEIVAICGDLSTGPLHKLLTHFHDHKIPLSIYSENESVIRQPLTKYFAAKNANLQVTVKGQEWSINCFRHGSSSERALGLDIVVAMYNCPGFIVPCVESLLTSPVREDINIIVVDDGSTDNSAAVVRDHFSTNPRVRLLSKHNGGCASARNYGRLQSNSSHIAFVDADDFADPNFFVHLYDLALHTGCEMVQGGFDFYTEGQENTEYTASYEDSLFADLHRVPFGGLNAIRVSADVLIAGQPTIWRRVYRRDFLDAKRIYFPESVRAFDDYIFHILSLYYARDVYMIPDIKLHYRQHANQDIKQGDERHFAEIYMFKLLLRRAIEEGWPDFSIFVQTIFNTISWSLGTLRPDLREYFAEASADFCWILEKVMGSDVFRSRPLSSIDSTAFHNAYEMNRAKFANAPESYVWAYIENFHNHPATLQMAFSMRGVH